MSLALPLAIMGAAAMPAIPADDPELPEGFSGAALMFYRALHPACPAPQFEQDYLIQTLRQSDHEFDDWVAGTAMADELILVREQAAQELARAKEHCVERSTEQDARAHQADVLQLDQALGLLDRIIVSAKEDIPHQREED